MGCLIASVSLIRSLHFGHVMNCSAIVYSSCNLHCFQQCLVLPSETVVYGNSIYCQYVISIILAMRFGDRFRTVLRAHGLTQSRAADLLEMDQSTISYYCN